MNLSETLSADFIDAQHRKWRSDPASLPSDWQYFFKGFEMAGAVGPADADPDQALRQSRVGALIHRYRDIGHLLACMDPLSACPTAHPLLDLETVGLEASDMERRFAAPDLIEQGSASLKTILGRLKQTYCHSIGVEYMHLQDPDERRWLQARMEPSGNRTVLPAEARIELLRQLIAASTFEAFLNKKYVGVTRFSLEGGEALIPLLNTVCRQSRDAGCRELMESSMNRIINKLCHCVIKNIDIISKEHSSEEAKQLARNILADAQGILSESKTKKSNQ